MCVYTCKMYCRVGCMVLRVRLNMLLNVTKLGKVASNAEINVCILYSSAVLCMVKGRLHS